MNKPRPFVAAYDQQEQYAGYDGTSSPVNYQQDYQAYPQHHFDPNYDTTYYTQQQEPMISNYNLQDYGRNVPDENDQQKTTRRESRHVPNERPSVPHSH
jgi:hypothetical protein